MIGLLMLLGPAIIYIVSIPFLGKLESRLRSVYLILGGSIVFLGGGFSFYLASYTGDQGGIAAYFFQKGVISAYALLSVVVAGLGVVARVARARSLKDESEEKLG